MFLASTPQSVTLSYEHGQADFETRKMVSRNPAIEFDAVKPRKRASRPLYAVNQAWRDAVKAEMAKQDLSVTDLAEAVGISHSMISQLLDDKGKAKSSKHVPKIHEVLGLPPPQEVQAMTPLQFRWMQLYGQLDEAAMLRLLELGETMATKKP
jgi:transcriptional regulator with XRE-family HTH domain